MLVLPWSSAAYYYKFKPSTPGPPPRCKAHTVPPIAQSAFDHSVSQSQSSVGYVHCADISSGLSAASSSLVLRTLPLTVADLFLDRRPSWLYQHLVEQSPPWLAYRRRSPGYDLWFFNCPPHLAFVCCCYENVSYEWFCIVLEKRWCFLRL